jgi:predicted AAA+ superfamily ATPase
MKKRIIFDEILERTKEPRKFIQVLLGPRQVGKTTLVLQLVDELNIPTHYATADTATLENLAWLQTQWEIARQKMISKKEGLLIIDEVQKISSWSNLIKKLWDEDSRNHLNLKVIILGSSPWLMQKGLTESLAGRFEIIPITHWNFKEMHDFFHWELDQFIFFGGYPGSAHLIDEEHFMRWINYINDSLIETTISRDILLMAQINKPILLRRLFQLGCMYSGQILSYQKMLGQLQDAGNTTTLSHYLQLLSGAGLLTGLNKFGMQNIRTRSSSPKFQVFNTALMSALSGKSFNEAKQDRAFWGRLVESAVGAYLLNSIRGTQIELYYWREKNFEVDFVLKKGNFITGIEVKSSSEKLSGMENFAKACNPSKMLLVGDSGIPIKDFLLTPIDKWMS